MRASLFRTICLMTPFVLPLGFALDLYLPSVPAMSNALSSDANGIQLTLSLFLYCFGLGQLVVGPLSDRFGRLTILKWSLFAFTVGGAICLFSDTLSMLLVGRALQAFGACGSQVISMAIVRDQHEGKEATIIFTALKGAMAIAPIAAPVLGAFLQVLYGWRANFLVLSSYGLFMLLLAAKFLKETRPTNIQDQHTSMRFTQIFIKPYVTIVKNKSYLYFCLCALATQAAMFGYFSLSPRFYVNEFGLSEKDFALLFSINACTFLITSLIVGKWIYRLGFRKSTFIAACLLVISGCFMLIGHYWFNHHFVLFLPNLIASSSASIMLGASASGAMLPFKQNAGSASALFGAMEFIGGGFIGSLAIIGGGHSVIPLAMILFVLGTTLITINFFFANRIDVVSLA